MGHRSTITALEFKTGILSGLSNDSAEQNENMLHAMADGDLTATFAALINADPSFSFTTTDLLNLFGTILTGSEGPFLSFTQMDLFRRLLVNTGTRSAGATHRRTAATSGVLYAQNLRAQQNEVASVDLIGEALSADGIVHPWVVANNIALPASAGLVNQFTMGPLSVNGVSITDLEEWSIDFNWTPTDDPQDQGQPYPVFKALMEYKPIMRIRSKDMGLLDTFNVPTEIDVNDVVAYLLQFRQGTTRWPAVNAPSKHMSFTIDEGTILATQNEAGQGDQAGVELIITPTDDGVNDVIAIATDVDIT